MKTKEEIISFLKKLHVLNKVYVNTRKAHDREIAFSEGVEVINWGFCWSDSPEGDAFWRRIDGIYRDWYNS